LDAAAKLLPPKHAAPIRICNVLRCKDLFNMSSTSAATPEDKRGYKQHQKNYEENLRDSGSRTGDTTKAQYSSDDSNNQECNSPTQHGDSPYISFIRVSFSQNKRVKRML
jgi:hypothetical protein